MHPPDCPAADATLRISTVLPGPVDVAASVEFLRRNGDDLLDRWDGTQLVRVLTLGGRRMLAAMCPTGRPAVPGLTAIVPAAVAAECDQDTLHTVLTSQFAMPPPS